jgi:hypothetical protein
MKNRVLTLAACALLLATIALAGTKGIAFLMGARWEDAE